MVGVAVVIVAILSSYSIALGKPGARHLPVAVMAPPAVLGKLEASPLLKVDPVPDLARARAMVEDRAAYGALVLPRSGGGILLVANGGGQAVETILVQPGISQDARPVRGRLRWLARVRAGPVLRLASRRLTRRRPGRCRRDGPGLLFPGR
jgi:hypothetical protein